MPSVPMPQTAFAAPVVSSPPVGLPQFSQVRTFAPIAPQQGATPPAGQTSPVEPVASPQIAVYASPQQIPDVVSPLAVSAGASPSPSPSAQDHERPGAKEPVSPKKPAQKKVAPKKK